MLHQPSSNNFILPSKVTPRLFSLEVVERRKKLRNYFQNENLEREYLFKFQCLFAILSNKKEVEEVLFY